MPVHDWTGAGGRVFHDLQLGWMVRLCHAANDGRMPADFYALMQPKPEMVRLDDPELGWWQLPPERDAAPTSADPAADRRVVVRPEVAALGGHQIGVLVVGSERLAAVLIIPTPRDKSSRQAVSDFAGRVVEWVASGVHVTVVDILPPGPHDPAGPHPEILARLAPDSPADGPPPGRPLTVAAYRAGNPVTAFLSYTAAGRPLPPAPLFLERDLYVALPLDQAYTAAYDAFPAELKAGLN